MPAGSRPRATGRLHPEALPAAIRGGEGSGVTIEDYYSPHSSHRLSEPLVLGGQVGSGVARVGRAMAARTGLRFTEIDRVVENGVGQSLGQLLRTRGPDTLTEASLVALSRALRRRPYGIIILGSGAVSTNDMADLTPRARFVYVMRPRKVLFDGVCAQLAALPGSLFQFQLATPKREEDLEPLLAAREGALRKSQTTVDAGDRHPNELATAILGILDRIMEVERI